MGSFHRFAVLKNFLLPTVVQAHLPPRHAQHDKPRRTVHAGIATMTSPSVFLCLSESPALVVAGASRTVQRTRMLGLTRCARLLHQRPWLRSALEYHQRLLAGHSSDCRIWTDACRSGPARSNARSKRTACDRPLSCEVRTGQALHIAQAARSHHGHHAPWSLRGHRMQP